MVMQMLSADIYDRTAISFNIYFGIMLVFDVVLIRKLLVRNSRESVRKSFFRSCFAETFPSKSFPFDVSLVQVSSVDRTNHLRKQENDRDWGRNHREHFENAVCTLLSPSHLAISLIKSSFDGKLYKFTIKSTLPFSRQISLKVPCKSRFPSLSLRSRL